MLEATDLGKALGAFRIFRFTLSSLRIMPPPVTRCTNQRNRRFTFQCAAVVVRRSVPAAVASKKITEQNHPTKLHKKKGPR
jgi:hypothetical protein